MKRIRFTTTQIILLSFLLVILIGSVLLALPISSTNGIAVPYIDALFTATTSTCVTGLVTLPTSSTWSVFGQIVILILIQVGGLGVITIMTGLMLLLNRKLGISDRLLIQEAFNLNTMSGLVSDFYKVRWERWINERINELQGKPFEAKINWFEWEWEWARSSKKYADIERSDNLLELSKEII